MLTFGWRRGDVHAQNLVWHNGLPAFDVVVRGNLFAHVELQVPGVHNVKNALAAAAAAWALHFPASAVEQGLCAFLGAGRRFERKGDYHGAAVYDDYAHHPGELEALFSAARQLHYRVSSAPSSPTPTPGPRPSSTTLSRVLREPDLTILAEIYAARETNELGISSADLAREIPGSRYCATLEEVTACLRETARPGDLILTVGAGDIYTAGEALLREG